MSPARALLLDLDGTLVESRGLLRSYFDDFLRARGREPSDEAFAVIDGPPLAVGVERLAARLDLPGEPAAVAREYVDGVRRRYAAEVAPLPGAVELLGWAGERRLALALVTSAPRALVDALLERCGWSTWFATSVCGGEAAEDKPGPGPFLEALERLGVPPGEAVALEDSPACAQSAAGLGVRTLLVSREAAAPPGVTRVHDLAAARERLEGWCAGEEEP